MTQAAFVDAYRAVLRGSSPDAPRAWLLAIAENVRRRRFRRLVQAPREEPLDEAAAPETAESPVGAQELRAALAELTPGQREVFALRELAGLSYDEIAEQTGSTVASVQMSLFRARQTLRACLEPPTVSRRGRGFIPVPGWLTHFAGRPDLALLTPRGFAAAGAAAVAIGGFAAHVDEPRAESRGAAVALEQPAATVAAPARLAAAFRRPAARTQKPVAPASRAARSAAPARTKPDATVPAAPAEPAAAAPADTPPAAAPPPERGGETPAAAPKAPRATPPTPTLVATVPLATPAVRLGALEVPSLALPPLPLPVPLPPLPEVAVPALPLPQVEHVLAPVLAPVVEAVAGAAGDSGIAAPPLPSNPLDTLPPALPSLRVATG